MLTKIANSIGKFEDKKWIIALIAAGIAVLAAAISVIVYFSKKEEEMEEDCFAE